jgi:polygalacturonase
MLVFRLILYIFCFVSPLVAQPGVQFNIVDDGAIGDGITDNTQSIRRTLTRAANNGLPSIVIVPAGDFLTGSLQLSSNITLRLVRDAILRASDNPTLYQCVPSITSDTGPCDFPFLLIDHAHDVHIDGEGRVDAGANSPPGHLVREYQELSNMLMPTEWNLTGCTFFSCRPKLMVIRHSYSVTLINVTLSNSPLWTVTIVESENVLFDGVTIIGDRRWPNNDGIDLINTRHVIIRNSNITTGDDCIAIVSHGPSAMFNITVENMDLQSTSAAIKVSVFEANATGNMSDMIFRDLRITDSNRGLCLAPRWGSGTISNLLFERMTIETRFFGLGWWGTAEPLHISAFSMNADRAWNGTVKNVTLRNIVARGEQGFIFSGNTSILQDIYLENISLIIDRWSNQSEHPSHDYRPSQEPQMSWARVDGIFASNINGFNLRHIQIKFREPGQNYYGQCLNLSNITQYSGPIDIECPPIPTITTSGAITTTMITSSDRSS